MVGGAEVAQTPTVYEWALNPNDWLRLGKFFEKFGYPWTRASEVEDEADQDYDGQGKE